MANLNEIASTETTTETTSTPTQSRRAASRARRAAESQANQSASTETSDTDNAVLDGLPPRDDSSNQQDGPVADGDNAVLDGLPERSEEGQVAAEAEQPKALTPLLVVADSNPKRAGTIAYGFFQKYFDQGGENPRLTTVEAAMERGVRGKDLSWDMDRGHILIEGDVAAYLELGDDQAAKREFLSKKFPDLPAAKLHKMAGIAVVEEPKAEAAKLEGEGTAPVQEPAAQTPEENKQQVEEVIQETVAA